MEELIATSLLNILRAANPAVAVLSIGTFGDSSSVTVIPASEQASVQALINSFDWSQAAWQVRDDLAHPARTALRLAAAQALIDNAAYQAIPNPSLPDVRAFTKKLAAQNSLIIARLTQIN